MMGEIYKIFECLIVFFLLVLLLKQLSKLFVSEKKRVGNQGENFAEKRIKQILRKDDLLFRNVKFRWDGRPAELDFVIVNTHGVFVIETKNYYGYLVGKEEDYEWEKYKKTKKGNIYEKKVKNPLKQVKRQVYLLSNYFKEHGVKVWIEGYAYMVNGNSPTYVHSLLLNERDVEHVIHSNRQKNLSPATIEKIATILRKL